MLSRMVDFAFPSARAACLLLDFDNTQSIRRLGFFNPRRNEVWLLDVDRITPELIDWTDRELIGYPA
ncbi:MAG: hypothetical protein ACLUA4_07760 [Bifidobacterium sp.]